MLTMVTHIGVGIKVPDYCSVNDVYSDESWITRYKDPQFCYSPILLVWIASVY